MTFLSLPEQRRGKVQKLAECALEIIPPWHFRDLGPPVFSIPVQAPKRKCHLFYLLGGIHQLNVTLRPGHDSSSLTLPRLLMSQHTLSLCVSQSLCHAHTLRMCPHPISDILNHADAWPCWGNLSHTGNLELVSAAFWTNSLTCGAQVGPLDVRGQSPCEELTSQCLPRHNHKFESVLSTFLSLLSIVNKSLKNMIMSKNKVTALFKTQSIN